MTDFARQHFDLALIPPLGGGREMLRGISRRPARFDLCDNRIDAFAHGLVPVFFAYGRLPADDKSSISATAVAHVSCAAVRSIDEIAELDYPAGRVRAAIKSHRPGAPTAWHGGLEAELIAGRRAERHQVRISHSRFQVLPDTEPNPVDHRGAGL